MRFLALLLLLGACSKGPCGDSSLQCWTGNNCTQQYSQYTGPGACPTGYWCLDPNRPPADMAPFCGDLSARFDEPTPPGCATYATCYAACLPGDPSCSSDCQHGTRSGASDKFQAALTCAQDYCDGVGDAGSGECLRVGNMLVNRDGTAVASTDPGTGQKACGRCLDDALARLLGATCSGVSSADCNPAACTALTSACLNDK